jgi:hypothetical protein
MRRTPRSSVTALFACALLIATSHAASGQDAPPATDTPETLAAMRAMFPPLPDDIPAWNALPAEVRRDVPELRIGMHRWHADPAQRFVVVEGRTVHEGGVLGRELWLREVREESVVVQFREHVFLRAR